MNDSNELDDALKRRYEAAFPSPEGERCSKCVFWEQWAPAVAEHGNCRRYPPTVGSNPLRQSTYPDTRGHQWCGEFWPKE
jgi:hypothetical protein